MKSFIASFCLVLCACSPPNLYVQSVRGSIHRGDVGGSRYTCSVRSISCWKAQPCLPPAAESTTDNKGQFVFSVNYVPAKIEAYAVLVQHHALCTQANGKWYVAWELTTGPALK